MPISHARRMNLIALAVLLTGLISLIAFHGLVFVDRRFSDEVVYGWQVWRKRSAQHRFPVNA